VKFEKRLEDLFAKLEEAATIGVAMSKELVDNLKEGVTKYIDELADAANPDETMGNKDPHPIHVVTCRFVCDSRTELRHGEKVNLQAIWSGHPENNNYSQATPQGSFEIYINNPKVYGFFKPNGVYDFEIREHGVAK